jgi:hypothetical protein
MSKNPRSLDKAQGSRLSEVILAKLRNVMNEPSGRGPELAWAGLTAAATLLGEVREKVFGGPPGWPPAAKMAYAAIKAIERGSGRNGSDVVGRRVRGTTTSF